MILEQIKGPENLKNMSPEELCVLAGEIRTFLIEKISHTGGHLASNLGVVELTIALLRTFDLPKDKIIWDVGHQSYTHKILSGRMQEFDELRQYGRKALMMPLIQVTALLLFLQVLALPRAGISWGKIIRWYLSSETELLQEAWHMRL